MLKDLILPLILRIVSLKLLNPDLFIDIKELIPAEVVLWLLLELFRLSEGLLVAELFIVDLVDCLKVLGEGFDHLAIGFILLGKRGEVIETFVVGV